MGKPFNFDRPIIGVTGSAGKTTTKEMIAAILKGRWKIFKTKGNRNSFLSTRRNKARINASHRAIVLEFGMKRRGQIAKHCKIIQPNIGVITSVGSAHAGNFRDGIVGVARVKSELIKNMHPQGILLINKDDENSKLLKLSSFKGTMISIGSKDPSSDYFASEIVLHRNGIKFKVHFPNGSCGNFYIPVYGEHNVNNALFAIAIADFLGFTISEIERGLKYFQKAKRRLNVYRVKENVMIIDDSYSANPEAMKRAIDVLVQLGNGKKVAVLGNMMELGIYSVDGHRDVGRYLTDRNIDFLYTFGDHAKYIGTGAIGAGFPLERVYHFTSRSQLNKHLAKQLQSNTTFLVKGSHSMRMNSTRKYLLKIGKGKKRLP